MTPIKWADPSDLYDHGDFGEVPILTLDQLEAWLKDNRIQSMKQEGYSPSLVTVARNHNQVLDELLAQVQAWRGAK